MDKKIFIKICGITSVEDAVECAKAGVDAIGFVFYPPSPRYLHPARAKLIMSELPGYIRIFGVFVNTHPDTILKTRDQTGIDTAQLHGAEPPEWAEALKAEGMDVCKAFFKERNPSFESIGSYPCDIALIESGRHGHGGTGKSWLWPDIQKIKTACNNTSPPILLAGGISKENVKSAIETSKPDGIDLSSGVEKAPGRKDTEKIYQLIEIISKIRISWDIFYPVKNQQNNERRENKNA